MTTTDNGGGKLIIKNTFYLYLNVAITSVLSLLSTRWILSALGVVDFGIYNLISGVVALLLFLNSSMAAATQRFMGFCIGEGIKDKIYKVFSCSFILHLAIAVIVVILLETVGALLLHYVLNIPQSRIFSASILYQAVVVCTVLSIVSVPYDASINAHEHMFALALINICSSILTFIFAISLQYIDSDRLIFYGMTLVIVKFSLLVSKWYYCYRKYEECKKPHVSSIDRDLLKEMSTFASWNLFGTISGACRSHGMSILLNYVFGVVINSAYGIAQQINSYLNYFTASIINAFRPQIMKSEGASEHGRMQYLSFLSSKITTLVLIFSTVPIITNMEWILSLWLKEVPQYTCIFCQLYIVIAIIYQMTYGLQMAIESTGKIRKLQMVVGSMHIVPLLVGIVMYCFYKFPPESMFILMIVEELIDAILRVSIGSKIVKFPFLYYIKCIILPLTCLFILDFILLNNIINHCIQTGFLRVGLSFVISTMFVILVSYWILFNRQDRQYVNRVIFKVLGKISLFR